MLRHMNLWFVPRSWIDSWNSIERIKSLKSIPMLFMTGTKDKMIPPSQTLQLRDAHNGKSDYHIFPEGQHHNMKVQPGYHTKFNEWVSERIRHEWTSVRGTRMINILPGRPIFSSTPTVEIIIAKMKAWRQEGQHPQFVGRMDTRKEASCAKMSAWLPFTRLGAQRS